MAKAGQKHGLPDDAEARFKIRLGLPDSEKVEWDEIINRIDGGKKPDKTQRKTIRKWKQQGKIPTPSKKFGSPSDKKTHQDS